MRNLRGVAFTTGEKMVRAISTFHCACSPCIPSLRQKIQGKSSCRRTGPWPQRRTSKRMGQVSPSPASRRRGGIQFIACLQPSWRSCRKTASTPTSMLARTCWRKFPRTCTNRIGGTGPSSPRPPVSPTTRWSFQESTIAQKFGSTVRRSPTTADCWDVCCPPDQRNQVD